MSIFLGKGLKKYNSYKIWLKNFLIFSIEINICMALCWNQSHSLKSISTCETGPTEWTFAWRKNTKKNVKC